jgi:stress response protein SCP2
VVLFGSRRRAEDLEVEVARLQAMLAELGALDDIQRYQRRQAAEQQLARVLGEEHAARGRITVAQHELAQLHAELVETRTEQLLQEAGVYEYAHPLESAVAYKDRLAALRADIKSAVTGRRAVTGSVDWRVNGSRSQGAKMVKDFSTLMLRAYNAEADNCVRTVKPHTVRTVRLRLDKTQLAIAKLGRTMSIAITDRYHQLRIHEIELTADYLAKVEAERELIRAQKEAAREEERARREYERQREKLLKEQAHYRSAYDRLLSQGAADPAALEQLRGQLDRLGADIASVEARAANTRAGYVYVISNQGSFGDHVVKIGMTRRLEPMDRVRELGDASVPFRFDVHALIFSDDAVGLENQLHTALAQQRVNKVNQHREFFRATPADVRHLLARAAGSHLLEFTETAEALEWRASGAETTFAPLPPEPVPIPPSGPAEDADCVDLPGAVDSPAAAASTRQLKAGQLVPLTGIEHLRLVVHTDGDSDSDSDVEIDPIAFLLTDQGTVRSDGDMVFYGQPDHSTGAVFLAADDTGATTALHVTPRALPSAVTEILLTAQLSAGRSGSSSQLHVLDLDTGTALGHIDLPTPGATGLLQLGALQRTASGWALQPQPSQLDLDLASLAAAAGISVE